MLINNPSEDQRYDDTRLWSNRFLKLRTLLNHETEGLLNSSYTNRLIRDIDFYINWLQNYTNIGQNSIITSASELIHNQMYLKLSSAIEQFLLDSISAKLEEVYSDIDFKFNQLYPHNLNEFSKKDKNSLLDNAPNFSNAIVNNILPVYGANPSKEKIANNIGIVHRKYSDNFNNAFNKVGISSNNLESFIRTRNKVAHGVEVPLDYSALFNFFYYSIELIRCIDKSLSDSAVLAEPSTPIQPTATKDLFFDAIHIIYNEFDDSEHPFPRVLWEKFTEKINKKLKETFSVHFVPISVFENSDRYSEWVGSLENWRKHHIYNISSLFPTPLIVEPNELVNKFSISGNYDNILTNRYLVDELINQTINNTDKNNEPLIILVPSSESDIENELEAFKKMIHIDETRVHVETFEIDNLQVEVGKILDKYESGKFMYPTITIDNVTIQISKILKERGRSSYAPSFMDKENKVNRVSEVIRQHLLDV